MKGNKAYATCDAYAPNSDWVKLACVHHGDEHRGGRGEVNEVVGHGR
jgi:hypothetical protein